MSRPTSKNCEWASLVTEYISHRGRPGPEWFTSWEFAKKAGISRSYTNSLLQRLMAKGVVERIRSREGATGNLYIYRRLK